jgi:GxxExxY protein
MTKEHIAILVLKGIGPWLSTCFFVLSPFRVFVIRLKNRKHKEERNVPHQFEELSSRILGAAVDVHKALGPGFIEPIYQRAMEVALAHRGIPFERQKEIHVFFESVDLGIQRLDLVVAEQIVLELKAVGELAAIHFAQIKSYLKATNLRVGLLLNFNAPTLVIKRIVL